MKRGARLRSRRAGVDFYGLPLGVTSLDRCLLQGMAPLTVSLIQAPVNWGVS